MNSSLIAKRIRQEREALNWTQQRLADEMGWPSHSTVGDIENEKREVKAWELLKLADIFKIPLDSLYQEGRTVGSEIEKKSVLWRKQPGNQFKLKLSEREVIQACENYQLLERLVVPQNSFEDKLPCFDIRKDKLNYRWVNQLAEKICSDFKLEPYPGASLTECLEERFGVLIINQPMEHGSAACWRGNFGYAIVLNSNEVSWRRVFSLAHELFHLLTWNLDVTNEQFLQQIEKYADAFAAALLMPQPQIDALISEQGLTYADVVALARRFKVSTTAMLLRLRYLKYISSETLEQTLKDENFKKLDQDTFKKASLTSPEFGSRFIQLSYLAYSRDVISRARIAQMLHINLRDVDEFFTEKGLFEADDTILRNNAARCNDNISCS